LRVRFDTHADRFWGVWVEESLFDERTFVVGVAVTLVGVEGAL
jgi:hypothetical protein